MATLDDFLPEPRLCELDAVHVDLPPGPVFARLRELDLAASPLVSALFWLRALPERWAGKAVAEASLRLRDLGREGPGFQVLAEAPDRLCVGAIGRFWEPDIRWATPPPEPEAFAAWNEPGFGKVAWELRCEDAAPERGTRVVIEVRVSATDDASWRKQQRYFALIGPFSRFIRRHTLKRFARELGAGDPRAGDALEDAPMPGDAAIPGAL